VRDRQESDDEDKLVLSTIHQAKGLEWDNVFVMHLCEGSFPHSRSYDEEGGLEEERRLFYVATTRARRKLFLTYPITAGIEHVDIRQPSTFVEEIPQKALEMVQLRRAINPYQQPTRSKSYYHEEDDEPTIVLDDLGERVKKPMPGSFLRDIDDL